MAIKMTLHYDVSEKDYINFNLYDINHKIHGKIIKLLCCVGVPVIFLRFDILYLIQNVENIEWLFPIVLVVISLLFVVGLHFLYTFLFKFLIKLALKSGKHNDFIGNQTLVLQDNCIEDINESMSSRITYSLVERICFDKKSNCFYIYIGAIKALVLPESSFADKNQKLEFFSTLKQKTGVVVPDSYLQDFT